MDGTNGSTTFVDSGPNALAVTAVGNAQISSSSKWGAGALTLDGAGDYLEYADNALFEFGSGDFTFESWIYIKGYSSGYSGQFKSAIFAKDSSSGRQFSIVLSGTASSFTSVIVELFASNASVTSTTASFTFSLNTWYFLQVVRSGSTVTIYIDGVSRGSGTNSTNIQNVSAAFRVGAMAYTDFEYYFNGLIDDVRITKGIARTISVPTAAYPDLYNPYTALPVSGAALWLDASQQSSLFTDAGATNVNTDGQAVYQWNDLSGNSRTALQTTLANRPVWRSPANGSNGFSATSYDGTNDFFSVSNTENWGLVFSGDFTIDLWAKFTDNTAQQDLLGQDTGGGQQPKWILGLNNPGVAGAGVLGFLYNLNNTQNYTFGVNWTPANNTLYRITVTRSGNDTKFYINGTQQGATNTSTNRPRAATNIKLTVGQDGEGYRYTKGQFGEVLFFPFAYSASDMTAMSAYSLAKWGVS